MKHFGDITKINGACVPLVDIVVGGSPCQDLSQAGKRAGLAGERSGLYMEQIRIIKEMRNESLRQLSMRGTAFTRRNIKPRFMVWENVIGATNSGTPKGEDFRIVIEEAARVAEENATIPRPAEGKWQPAGCVMGDGWSIAWRIHDAQFWGVPQRRKRIALVADFGGQSAPEVLFERTGLFGNIEQGTTQGKEIAGTVGTDAYQTISFQERAGKPGGGKGILIQHERVGTLSTFNNQSVLAGVDVYNGEMTGQVAATITAACGGTNTSGCKVMCAWDGGQVSPTLTANNAGGGQRMPDKDNFNAVITYGLDRASFNQGKNAQYQFSVEEELAQTIVAKGVGGVLTHK